MAPIDDRPSDFNFRLFIPLLGYIVTHFAGTRRHNEMHNHYILPTHTLSKIGTNE